jgi:hypothetical protein
MAVIGSLKPPTSRAKRKTFAIMTGALAPNYRLNSYITSAKAPAICGQKHVYYVFSTAFAAKIRNAEVQLWVLKTIKP